MKVYIVEEFCACEGSQVDSVHITEESAEVRKVEIINLNPDADQYPYSVRIREYTVRGLEV